MLHINKRACLFVDLEIMGWKKDPKVDSRSFYFTN